jgi:hypothetical protein
LRKIKPSGVTTVQCPIFTHEEDFCLHENCRYYDIGTQECVYHAGSPEIQEQIPSSGNGAPGKVPEEIVERRADSEQITGTQVSQQTDTAPKESGERKSGKDTSSTSTMTAKDVWDRLKQYNEKEGIPGYESLIESLIQVVNSTPGMHYLTPKETDFWRSEVHGINRYLVRAETACM